MTMRFHQLITLLAIRSVAGFSPSNTRTSSTFIPHHNASYKRLFTSTTNLSASTMKDLAEGVLKSPKFPPEWPYSPSDFERQDESDDSIFYDQARLVYHIDDSAVSALTKYYATNLKDGDDVLDICSSWVSHYPKDFKGGNVVGLGMNEYELSQNEQLSSFVVKDLNEETKLPFDDESFDKVTIVVSVDYLNKPKEVFDEIGRVLRPGGECIISMSNRCFPTKAFRSEFVHIFLISPLVYVYVYKYGILLSLILCCTNTQFGCRRMIWNISLLLGHSFTTLVYLNRLRAKTSHLTQEGVIYSSL